MMNMIKKILPLSVLACAGLMLVLSVVDVFTESIVMFDLFFMHLGALLLLLLSLGLTVLVCVEQSLRRPLTLLACLLHTPIGGGLLVLYVYEWAFPDDLPLELLLPFVMMLVCVASALQAGVTILCAGIYAEETGADEDESEADGAEDELAADNRRTVKEIASVPASDGADDSVEATVGNKTLSCGEMDPTMGNGSSDAETQTEPSDPAPETARPRITPVAVPVRTAPVEITPEDEDDLAPIPKKKSKNQPIFESMTRPAVPKVPAAPEVKEAEPAPAKPAPVKEKEPKKAYTDPFGLLTEEVKPENSSAVKSIFGEENTDGNEAP